MSSDLVFGLIFFLICIVGLPAMWSSYATPTSWVRQLVVEVRKLMGRSSKP